MTAQMIARILMASALFLLPACTEKPTAAVTLQFQGASPEVAEKILLSALPAGDPSVRVRAIRNTELFEIGVTDGNPTEAARRANQFGDSLPEMIKTQHPGMKVIIWERAEAP